LQKLAFQKHLDRIILEDGEDVRPLVDSSW
jgi:hypothetical protein